MWGGQHVRAEAVTSAGVVTLRPHAGLHESGVVP
jgi:hypothetical protein